MVDLSGLFRVHEADLSTGFSLRREVRVVDRMIAAERRGEQVQNERESTGRGLKRSIPAIVNIVLLVCSCPESKYQPLFVIRIQRNLVEKRETNLRFLRFLVSFSSTCSIFLDIHSYIHPKVTCTDVAHTLLDSDFLFSRPLSPRRDLRPVHRRLHRRARVGGELRAESIYDTQY